MFLHAAIRSMCKYYNLKSVETSLKRGYLPVHAFKGARHLNIGVARHHKMFIEFESRFAYDLMESNGHVKCVSHALSAIDISDDLQLYIAQNWSEKTPQQLYEAFRSLTKYCSENKMCISNKMFDEFIDNLTDNIQYLNDEQLETLFWDLTLWPKTESVKTRNFIEVWAALDDACLARMKDWTVDQKLSFAAITYHLNIGRLCEYTNKCVQRLISRAAHLTTSQLVQACFYLSVVRKPPLDKHNIELYLQNHFHEFTISDLAIISMGFFKSRTPIRNMDLMSLIIEKIIAEVDEIDEISLAALLKLVRYSMKYTKEDIVYRLLGALQGQVARLSVMACVQLALVGTTTQTLHKPCLATVAQKVAAEISTARMKDLERLTLTFSCFDYHVPGLNFVEMVLDELRSPVRREEIAKYGRAYACCISFATMLGHYPYDLIDHVLDPKFINSTYGDRPFTIGKEILVLENTVEINCPDYKGNRLPNKTLRVLAKNYTDYVPDEDYKCQYNKSEKLMLDFIRISRKYCDGNTYVYGDHALTHFQRGDIFLCNSKDGKPVDISSHFPIKPFGPVKRAPTDDTWIAFIIAARNAYVKDTEEVTGPYKTKYRELKKVGYHPTVVSCFIWDKLNSDEEKIDYVKRLIKEAVKT